MAGQEEGHDLVPELLVRHPLTALVLGQHEHGEEITPILLSALAALLDDGVDDRVEPPGRYLERQARHLFVDVDSLAISLAFERALGEDGHHLSVSSYSLAVEGRLGEPSLASPELALARQEPIAEQAAVSL